MKISVVIPTYKRPKLLERCLTTAVNQSFDRHNYEIIVVSDGPDNDTQKIVDQLKKDFSNLHHLALKHHQGPAAARNAGWKFAKSEIIAFTDDDTVPDKNWLFEGFRSFAKDIAAVTGKVVVPQSKHPTDYEKNTVHLGQAEFVTANVFISKKALEKVNGFDETFKAAWREDSDIHFKLLKNDLRIMQQNKAIVIHPVRKSPWGVSVKEQKKSMYNALLYKKHPDLYLEKIQAIPPWNYYVIVGSFLMMVLEIIGRFNLFALLFGTVWLLFSLLFFFSRIEKTDHSFHHVSDILVTSFVIPFLSIYWRLVGAIKYKVYFL